MEKISIYLPFIVMIIVGYFIYQYLKSKKIQPKNIPNQNNDELLELIKKEQSNKVKDPINLIKDSIAGFVRKMEAVSDWYKIIQTRGNSQAKMSNIGVKVDDYEYWANAHKDEYILKYNDGDLDVEGIKLRIKKFGVIVTELEKLIKKAAELKLNITNEMFNDYCAARASVLGAEYTLKEIFKKDQKINKLSSKKQKLIRINENETEDVGIITHFKGKPFTGISFALFNNGKVESEITFKKGLKEGEAKTYFENGQLKNVVRFEKDEAVEAISAYEENGKERKFKKSTKKSNKRLTYILQSGENGEKETEVESVSSILGFGDDFYNLSDWEQINILLEAFKEANDGRMFITWLANEFRFMKYSFDDKIKPKLADKIVEFWKSEITIKQLEKYFKQTVNV